MSYQDLLAAFDLIAKDGSGDFIGHIDESVIDKAEAALKLTFPPTYRKFLRDFGCGGIRGREIYGIVNDDFVASGIPDAIWLTLKNRKAGLPMELVIIAEVGNGDYYALDGRKRSITGEYPVIVYSILGSIEQVSSDFGEFLLSFMEESSDR
jgi:antitoxin YobK